MPLKFSGDVRVGEIQARNLEQLRPFLEDPTSLGPDVIYTLYDDVCCREDESSWAQAGLKYSLTVLSPGTVSQEWHKTAGHYHGGLYPSEGGGPEVVEILSGKGAILVQTMRSSDRIADIMVVEGTAGLVLVLPPNTGHVLVNTGPDVFVAGHVFSRATRLEYEEMARHRGAGYYIGPGGPRQNGSYLEVPRRLAWYKGEEMPLWRSPKDGVARLEMPEGVYKTFMRSPRLFRFVAQARVY